MTNRTARRRGREETSENVFGTSPVARRRSEATCAAIEGGATRRVRAETRNAAANVLALAAAPGCRLGGRARFLAERALDALRADDDSSRERADARILGRRRLHARRGSAPGAENHRRRRVSARSSRRAARDASLGRARGGVGGDAGGGRGEGVRPPRRARRAARVDVSVRRIAGATRGRRRVHVRRRRRRRTTRTVGSRRTTRKTDRVRVNFGTRVWLENRRGKNISRDAARGATFYTHTRPRQPFANGHTLHPTPYTLHPRGGGLPRRLRRDGSNPRPTASVAACIITVPWDTVANTNRGGSDSTPASSIRFAPSPFARASTSTSLLPAPVTFRIARAASRAAARVDGSPRTTQNAGGGGARLEKLASGRYTRYSAVGGSGVG